MASPHAFVTLLTSDSYLPGALTLAAALKDIHPFPAVPPEVDFQTVCLVTPETVDVASIKLLRKAFDVVVGVEIIKEENERGLQLLGRPDLNTVLTKLHVFRLTQYTKIIFLDADILPIRPLSHLFTLPHDFSAVPDVGWPDIFNSGFMVLSPGEDKFKELMTLSKSKGSWDGADQGLLNEWRGSDWNRLSFTYNTTPTAVYTYAPAYERFGSQISALHFIGANKPWSSIPWRAPGSSSAQQSASQPLQVYDYGSLVDRWYAVYDKHYRSQPVIPQAAYASARYDAVWDQGSSVAASDAPAVPATSALSLEDLRRIAIEGFSGITSVPRTSVASFGEGSYISLPLDGRLDLMRPRPAPEKGLEASASAGGQSAPSASVADQPTFDDNIGSSTPEVPPHSFRTGDLPRHYTVPDSVPYFNTEPSVTIPSASSPSQQTETQLAAAAPWQIQPGLTSILPQDLPRSYHLAGPSHTQPQSINPQIPNRIGPEYPQGTGDHQIRDVQGPFTGHQHATQSFGGIGESYTQSGQMEKGFPARTYLQGSVHPHVQRQFPLPSEQKSESISAPKRPAQSNEEAPGLAHQSGQPQKPVHLLTQSLPQAYYQAQEPQQFYVQRHGLAPNLGPQQIRLEQEHFVRHEPEHVREHSHQQVPPPQEPIRPKSPPLMTWNPAVEPPPKTAPVSNFPTSTYYPNVWDQSPSHRPSEWSPSQETSSTLFTIPPPSRIPERLLHEKHYANVLGDGKQGETPSPDRTKIKPVFPWEDKPRLTPGRIFPSTDSPPPGQFLLPVEETVSPSPSPPLRRFSPTHSYISSPPSGFPPSFSYTNAWDSVPSIQQYASRLVRPPQNMPPLAPAFDYGESRRRESALFRNWHESGESSVDGDDEDTEDEGLASKQRSRSGSLVMASHPYYGGKGKKKEYRSQGVQTIPKETRDQSVQVTILTDRADADRSIKDKERGPPPRSRQSSYSGVSPTLTVKQRDLAPSLTTAPGPQGFGTSFIDDVPKLSPLGSPTGLRSPRYVSPRGSSTSLAESTPRPSLYKSTTQGPSTPQRLLPMSVSRTISSDTASSPSSAGPPVSPEDPRPMRRAGGRVWDPARGVEIFKRGSEEVLTRFLKMGSWEEEKELPT